MQRVVVMEESDPYLQRQIERKKILKERWLMLLLCLIILLATVIGLADGLNGRKSRKKYSDQRQLAVSTTTIQSVCNSTAYPDTCITSLSAYNGSMKASPKELLVMAMNIALQGVNGSLHLAESLVKSERNATINVALQDCLENLADSIDQINVSISHFFSLSLHNFQETLEDIQTFLSSALTFQTTCTDDGFEGISGRVSDEIRKDGGQVKKLVSNALGLISTSILSFSQDDHEMITKRKHVIPSRRLLSDFRSTISYSSELAGEAFPKWSRKLLLEANTSTVPNVTVAEDGSGQFLTIQDAVNSAPQMATSIYIIHIKAGVYWENVTIPKTTRNLMFHGDGIGKTIITGNKSVVQSGVSTFDTASVVVRGNGFIARDLTIENTAGAAMHQAVALRVSADLVAFYRCSFSGYQDTLYTHTLRQFYKECTISGTVDFIFGNSAAVFQQCTIIALLPLPGQQNTITAQGRTDQFQNTGLSFHICNVVGASDLQNSIQNVSTFLGRPWKEYSRTVFMLSNISDVVDPAGWLEWNATPFALKTLFYGEYNNTGDGAATKRRVNWSTVMKEKQAKNFTVETFLDGKKWLPFTHISFIKGLYS